MLVTFEGLDGAGKSTIIRAVAARLRGALRRHVLHLGDISQSPTGHRLGEVFRADELFGPDTVGATVLSRCLAAAADLFYFDGALIAPMVAAGGIVLKERHIDTFMSHEGPVLTTRCGWSHEQAYEWLSTVVQPLHVLPTLTIMVEAPLCDRERRLAERLKQAGVALSPANAEVDRAVFHMRGAWYERLRLLDPNRWISVDNPDGALDHAVTRIMTAILDRHAHQDPPPRDAATIGLP